MHSIRQALLAVAVVSLTLTLSSCSSHTRNVSPGESGGAAAGSAPAQFYTPPGATLHVTYTEKTVRIDFPTAQRTLRSVSADGRLLLFDASEPRIAALTEGKVIFLEHLGVRRVVAALRQGSQIAVLTDTAALTDFIQDGQIKFSMPVRFRRAQAQVSPWFSAQDFLGNLPGWFGPLPVAYASEEKEESLFGLHAKGEVNGWEFELEGGAEGDGLKLAFEAGKKLSGLTASVKAEGKVEHISTVFDAVVRGGKVQNFEYSTPLQGKFHVGWAALTHGANGGIEESRLKLPPFAKRVLDIYGIPFLFQVEENLIFKPGFGTPHDAAEGGFDFTYSGSGGISVQENKTTPEGKMDGEYSLQSTTSESLAAHGIVLALNAPRASISLGTESFAEAIKEALPKAALDKAAEELKKVPFFKGILEKAKEDFFKLEGSAYVQLVTEFDFAASGPLSLVPCKKTHLNLIGEAGVDAQLLALKSEDKMKTELLRKGYVLAEPNSPICGETVKQ